MRVQSWLATTTSGDPAAGIHPISDDSVTSASSSSLPSTSSSSHESLQSNASLQTLPSIPSVQHSSDHNLRLSVTHTRCLSSLKQPDPIASLALTPDLLLAASGHRVHVYHKTTLTLLHTFNGDPSSGSVKSLAVDAAGKVFTAHQDSKIRVWTTKTTPSRHNKHYELLATLPTVADRLRRCMLPKNYASLRRHKKLLWIEHADAVTSLAVTNGVIYSVSWDKTLKIWRASDLRCMESVNAHDDAVNAVAVSPDGAVYTGSADRRIRVWAKPGNEKNLKHALVATLEKHRSAVNALALNDDGSVLFSGACDRSILVWNKNDSDESHMVVAGALRGHEGSILSLVHVAGFLFSGSADRTVRMWAKGRDERYCCLTVLEGHEKPVRSLAAEWEERDGVVLVTSGSLDGEVKVWQVSLSSTGKLNF